MSLKKLPSENTIEWKIKGFNGTILEHRSPEFVIHNHMFSLEGVQALNSLWSFCLVSEDNFLPIVAFSFGVIDSEGLEFITTKGYAKWDSRTGKANIAVFEDKDHYDAVTVHFTFKAKDTDEDVQVEETPNVVESSNQTESPKTVIMNDMGTNTEMPDAVEQSNHTETPEPLVKVDTSTNTDEEPTSMLQTLSNDLLNLYKNATSSDYLLRAGAARFPVHRAVLSARSPVFQEKFLNETGENRTKEMEILNVQETILADIIYYMYAGKIRNLTPNTAAFLFDLADKYELTEYKTVCLEFLKSNLTVDNICDAAILTDTYEKNDLEEVVIEFIEGRLEEINKSSKWTSFANVKPMLANKLLLAAFLSSRNRHIRDASSD